MNVFWRVNLTQQRKRVEEGRRQALPPPADPPTAGHTFERGDSLIGEDSHSFGGEVVE